MGILAPLETHSLHVGRNEMMNMEHQYFPVILIIMLILDGRRHLPNAPQLNGAVVDQEVNAPEEDLSVFHALVNLVLKEDLIRKDGTSRYSEPVLLLLPYKFRPGYVPSVPGIKVVLGERADIEKYKTVVTIRNVRQTEYGFTIEVVHNPHMSMGSSGRTYSFEQTPNGWRSVPLKGEEMPLGWKS